MRPSRQLVEAMSILSVQTLAETGPKIELFEPWTVDCGPWTVRSILPVAELRLRIAQLQLISDDTHIEVIEPTNSSQHTKNPKRPGRVQTPTCLK
ncbi:hypothetical protein BDV18DRAFT_135777 [Aspergillus unguis]